MILVQITVVQMILEFRQWQDPLAASRANVANH